MSNGLKIESGAIINISGGNVTVDNPSSAAQSHGIYCVSIEATCDRVAPDGTPAILTISVGTLGTYNIPVYYSSQINKKLFLKNTTTGAISLPIKYSCNIDGGVTISQPSISVQYQGISESTSLLSVEQGAILKDAITEALEPEVINVSDNKKVAKKASTNKATKIDVSKTKATPKKKSTTIKGKTATKGKKAVKNT
jgi:hypothetical protein